MSTIKRVRIKHANTANLVDVQNKNTLSSFVLDLDVSNMFIKTTPYKRTLKP
jgi:hypothetical protein